MRRQEQSGGDDSVNVQAGQDAAVYIGVTASEARDIALDVFRANFMELRGIAEDVARDRAERITHEFVEALQARNPEGLSSIQDPDMQMAIYNAQKGYACSGEEDLEATLIDLLVERSGQKSRDLKTLALNQAISCAPQLTVGQRKLVAVSFFVRNTRFMEQLSLPVFYQHIAENLIPLVDIESNRLIDCRYLQSAGVGAVSQFSLKLEEAFWQVYSGYLFNGFTRDQAEGQLRAYSFEGRQIRECIEDRSIFVPCIRNGNMLQVNAISLDNVRELQAIKGLSGRPGSAGPLETLCLHGRMSEMEIKEELVSHVPAIYKLFDHWDSSGLGSFDLTAVGIVIGHAYWNQITGSKVPVNIWLQ